MGGDYHQGTFTYSGRWAEGDGEGGMSYGRINSEPKVLGRGG